MAYLVIWNQREPWLIKRMTAFRKEFEKWAVMTYTGNRAVINQKKGADAGIDGTAYFRTNKMIMLKSFYKLSLEMLIVVKLLSYVAICNV